MEAIDTRVPGPRVFFWMVSFALNAMAQPYGRLCGLSYDSQFMLGTSPIICAFDAINVLVTWLASVAFAGRSRRGAATRIMRERFTRTLRATSMADPTRCAIVRRLDVEGIASLRNFKAQRRERLMMFAFGVLPQFIKLFGSQGLPLIQAFGAMYLASWVTLELLLGFADLEHIDDKSPEWMISVYPSFRDWHIRQWWGGLGLLVHCVIHANFYFALLPIRLIAPTEQTWEDALYGFSWGPTTNVTMLFFIALLNLPIFFYCFAVENWRERESEPKDVDGSVKALDTVLKSGLLRPDTKEEFLSKLAEFCAHSTMLISNILYSLSSILPSDWVFYLLTNTFLGPFLVPIIMAILGLISEVFFIISHDDLSFVMKLSRFSCTIVPFLVYTYKFDYLFFDTVKPSWDDYLG